MLYKKSLRSSLAEITFLKKMYYFFKKNQMTSSSRREANLFLRRECKNTLGHVIHVGSKNDYDKMGMYYRWYFKKCTSYKTLDIEGETDFKQDITNMRELRKEEFDAVLCPWVLEHIKSIDKAVDEIQRILKPGGFFFFSLPTTQSFHGYPHDYWRFRIEDITSLLKNFSIVKIQAIGKELNISSISKIDKNLKWYSNYKHFSKILPEAWVGLAKKN